MPRLEWVLRRTAACCVLLVLASVPSPWMDGAALGAGEQHPVVAIIDMQEILRESKAVQEMQRRLEELRSDYQEEFRKKEEALRERDQALSRDRNVLSADSFAQRRQDLERAVATAQREIQQRREGLEALFGQGMNQVRLELISIVQDIASKRGADLVLAKTTVVLVRPDLEITAEALEQLNQRLPRIELPTAGN
ncbi:MAG: OmpH family outer membrane protein [Kiloniellales bacterium]